MKVPHPRAAAQRKHALPDITLVGLLLGLMGPHRRAAILVVAMGALASFAEGLGLGLFIPFLQSLSQTVQPSSQSGWLVGQLTSAFSSVAPERRLAAISGFIFLSILLKAGLVYASSLLFTRITVQVGHRLRSAIFDQILTVDYRFLHAAGAAKFMNALHTESWRTTHAMSTLLDAAVTIIALVVYVILLLLISWQLTLIVVALLALIAALVQYIVRHVGDVGAQMTRTNAELARRMVDGVDGIEVIRAFGRESHERDRFAAVSQAMSRLLLRLGRLSSAVYPVYEVLVAAILVGLLVFSVQGPADVAPLLVFVFLLYRLEPKVKELDRARVDLVALDEAVRDTVSLISREGKSYLESGSRPFTGLRQGIRFDRVSFGYADGGTKALDDVSVDLPARSTVAVVGPSGSGKSTFIRLLLRFYDPGDGRVLVDGVPLPELDLHSWRARLAVVNQKVFLFSATIFDNIAYGADGAGPEAVERAAREAGAHDFISRLPAGYLTRVGDGGVQLSGGEEQRISLARAIIRQPDLLILDEATNALDNISERLVQDALEVLRHRCTIVIVAHRLSTVERADQILVLQDGAVAERGTLTDLLEMDGLFARLYRLQKPLPI